MTQKRNNVDTHAIAHLRASLTPGRVGPAYFTIVLLNDGAGTTEQSAGFMS